MSELITAEQAKAASAQLPARVEKLIKRIDEYITGATNRGEFKVFIEYMWFDDGDGSFYGEERIIKSLEDRGFIVQKSHEMAFRSGISISWE